MACLRGDGPVDVASVVAQLTTQYVQGFGVLESAGLYRRPMFRSVTSASGDGSTPVLRRPSWVRLLAEDPPALAPAPCEELGDRPPYRVHLPLDDGVLLAGIAREVQGLSEVDVILHGESDQQT